MCLCLEVKKYYKSICFKISRPVNMLLIPRQSWTKHAIYACQVTNNSFRFVMINDNNHYEVHDFDTHFNPVLVLKIREFYVVHDSHPVVMY